MPPWQGYRVDELHPPGRVYAAVIALRKKGHKVERHENRDRHVVDGEIVPTSWLLDRAKMAGAFPGAMK